MKAATLMSEPYTLIYITGRGHSGSTLLDLLLSSHSEVAGMGEIKVLSRHVAARREKSAHPHPKPLLDGRCACGVRPVLHCPFWLAVDARIRHDAGLRLADLDLYSQDQRTFVAHNRAILRAIRTVTGRRFIVDLSKDLRRLKRLVGTGVCDVLPVHIVRNPLGVVYSNLRNADRSLAWYALTYTHVLLRTRFYLRRHTHLEMSYEALATSPEHELDRAMAWLGLSFEPTQMDWAHQDHHHIDGNAMRLERTGTVRLDRQWETGLSSWQKICIRTLTLPTGLPIGGS